MRNISGAVLGELEQLWRGDGTPNSQLLRSPPEDLPATQLPSKVWYFQAQSTSLSRKLGFSQQMNNIWK